MKKEDLTQQRLKELLHYDPDTGVFTWLTGQRAGLVAGSMYGFGYIMIKINQCRFCAHRLAFLYIDGEFPADDVDHINRIRDDNRWRNLRRATAKQNQENKCTNNDFIGVSWSFAHEKWIAYSSYTCSCKNIYLGIFKTHIAACYARHFHDVGGCNARI